MKIVGTDGEWHDVPIENPEAADELDGFPDALLGFDRIVEKAMSEFREAFSRHGRQ